MTGVGRDPARLAIQRPPTQQPYETQAAPIEPTRASNVRCPIVNIPRLDSARKRPFEEAFVQPSATVASPPEERQPPHPGPPTTAAAANPLSSSHGINTGNLPRLDAFLDQIRVRGYLNGLASCRASILRDACIYQDTFYLCLHQIFCRATADPLFTMQIGFGDEQFRGFEVMQAILLPNGDLPSDVLQFFATFPYPDPTRASPMLAHIVAQVRAFLSGLDREWEDMRQTFLARGYPPFSDELRARLRLGSAVFQKVLFSSIHRQLGGMESPVWIEQGFKLFDENQRQSQERLAVNGYPPSEEQVQAEVQLLGKRYLNLRAMLQLAGFQISSVLGMPPTGMDSQLTQPPSVGASGTAPPPDPISLPSHTGTPSWNQDGLPPSQVRHPFDQSHPHVNRLRQPPVQQHYSVTNMQQRPPQGAVNVGSHIQQGQSRRQGRPPMSHNRQSSRPTTSPTLPSTPTTTTSQSRNLASDSGLHVNTTASVAVSSSSRISNQSDTLFPPFLPPFGQEPIQGINQNHRIVALHQAHLRSPKYLISNVQDLVKPSMRLYQVPTGCALSPQVLGQSCPYFSWQFEISRDHLQRKAKDLLFMPDPSNPASVEPVRHVAGGSVLYRLKCIAVAASTTSTSMPEEVWVTRETVWPQGVFLAINDKQLEVRRRLHHGKDLTIDLTMHVKEGLNTLTCSVLRITEEMKLGKNFAIAVEVVEIISDERIKDLPFLLYETDAMEAITKSLNRGLPGKRDKRGGGKDEDEDEEIQVVDAHISIDITDPYTARVFEVPVRGKTCFHRECFDLQTFLDTRKARTSEKGREAAPTSPDEWKCPICKKDARPQNLVVDGFLQKVRKELGERDQLDAKAIRVQADGTWEPVLEADTKNGNWRESTNTDDVGGAASRSQSVIGHGPGVAAERRMGQKQGEAGPGHGRGESVVIELD